jgi:pre-mRNA-splicing factor SYF1
VYIQRVAELYGVTATRDIYERAIGALSDMQAKDICIRYAELERKLGEIDRARAIYGHASQFCDPRIIPSFWKTWQEFEIKHGNEDTFREMLRIKRSVQAKYNTQVNFLSA